MDLHHHPAPYEEAAPLLVLRCGGACGRDRTGTLDLTKIVLR